MLPPTHPRRPPSILRVLAAVGAVLGVAAVIIAIRLVPQFKRGGALTSRLAVAQIRSAALEWQREHPGRCPKLRELISDRWLDGEFNAAACHGLYTIQCTEDDVVVSCTDPAAR
jgi:hypothetical protein